MQKTVSILIFENSFPFSCYKLSKFWNGSSGDFSEKGRENMRSSTAESTRVGCDVTWDQYQLMLLKEDTVHFLHAKLTSQAWWEWLHITTKTKRNHILIMKKVLINCKLRECMPSSWRETVSPLPHVSINLILGLPYPFHGNTEQIGNTDK